MDRRTSALWLASSLLTGPLQSRGADAQQRHRIGVLCPTWEDLSSFVEALSAVGYNDGRNIHLQYARWSSAEQLEARVGELVAARVDAIAAVSSEEIRAAKRATSTIPIVMLYGVAPIELGLVESLVRPGGNVTGTIAVPLELVAKSVEIFREAFPRMRRVTALVDTGPSATVLLREARRSAQMLGMSLADIQIAGREDLDRTFAELDRQRPDGLIAFHGLFPQYPPIIRFAALRKLPVMYGVGSAVLQGGLMSLTPNLQLVFARSAAIVGQILKGAKAGDIPVEQPLEYLLAVNMRTARALGIQFPRSVTYRANYIVE